MRLLLGIDVGSSAVKASLLDVDSGVSVSSASSPDIELPILSLNIGWAEQDPKIWWEHVILAVKKSLGQLNQNQYEVLGIGIAYQMHGLVLLDQQGEPLRPAIIWCDSRAVDIGNRAFEDIGPTNCLNELLNSPGNFTASKLRWVYEHEPELYEKIHKFMLPGDYIAYKLTGEIQTTASGLSEGVLWNFVDHETSRTVCEYYDINGDLVPPIVPSFGVQGSLTPEAAELLGLKADIPISYRAGDQPNNAFALNVLDPGEVAATAGTSGVIYAVTDQAFVDPKSRVNSFMHVNSTMDELRCGVLFCLNGTGCCYSWLRSILTKGEELLSYESLNAEAAMAPVGSDGLLWYPFGNGAERVFGNLNFGASFESISFARHDRAHMVRALQEGVVYALFYGLEVLRVNGFNLHRIRAGAANLFLSPLFSEVLASLSKSTIDLYNTDGAEGAARAAGIGCGVYSSNTEAFEGLKTIKSIEPNTDLIETYQELYLKWKEGLSL